jgi:hypothetical protein
MDMVSVGRWIMIVIGALALLVAIWITLKGKSSLLIWIFGILLLGIGSFGMEFMPKYSDWLSKVSDMIKTPGKESYEAFFASVSKQKLPAELQQIGIEYAINHPIEGMESIIKGVIDRTPENTEGRKALNWAMENFKGKQRVIDQILESKPKSEVVQNFDQATGEQVFNKLNKLSPDKLWTLEIDPRSIKNFSPLIGKFPVKKHR